MYFPFFFSLAFLPILVPVTLRAHGVSPLNFLWWNVAVNDATSLPVGHSYQELDIDNH